MAAAAGFTVGVIGPTTVRDDNGQQVRLSPSERTLLCRLALATPHDVTTDQLVMALWGEHAPATARKTLQTYVRSARQRCGHDIIATSANGYRLGPVARCDVDVAHELLGRLHASDATEGVAIVAQIEALWPPGEPLEDLHDHPDLKPERERLRRLRGAALLDCARTQLLYKEPARAEHLAERVLDADPYDEAAWQIRLQALLDQNRRAEVTTRFLQAHRRLAEAGLEPGEELTTLHLQSLGNGSERHAAQAQQRMRMQPSTRLVGRADDVVAVMTLLEDHPVVTISGPGGVGKTRLALAVIEEEAAKPAAVAELSTTTDRKELLVSLAAALDATPGPSDDLADAVLQRMGAADGLILLDCADLVVIELARLLTAVDLSPKTRLLITSRQRLGIPEEVVWRLDPLPTIAAPDQVPPARELLSTLASQGGAAGYPPEALDAISQRLDGLPLALELAGARLASVPAQVMLQELDDRLSLGDSSGARPARHRTIGETLRWSYDRLDDSQRQALGVMSLLPAGAEPDLLNQLGVFEGTVGLTEASMAYLDVTAGRYKVLDTVQELGRDLAVPRLTPSLVKQVLEFQLALATELDRTLRSPQEGWAADRMIAELPNLRASFNELGRRGESERQILLASKLSPFVTWRSRPDISAWVGQSVRDAKRMDTEGFCEAVVVACWEGYVAHDTDAVLAMVDGAVAACPPEYLHQAAELITMAGHALADAGQMEQARERLLQSLTMAEETDNGYGAVMARGALTLYGALTPEMPSGLAQTAERARADAAQLGVPSLLSWVWFASGVLHLRDGINKNALAALEESLALAEESGAKIVEASARRTWTAISPGLGADEVLASHLRTFARMREGGHDRQSLSMLPWMVQPLLELGRHRQVLLVERLLRRFGRGGRVHQAPGYAEGVRQAIAALGPVADTLLTRPVSSLSQGLDDLVAQLNGLDSTSPSS